MYRALACLVLALAACSTPTEPKFERIQALHVASSLVACHQWYGPSECLQVRTNTAAEWRPLFQGIVGFTHEVGFEYELLVVEYSIRNPPADGSSREYRLARILRRIQVPPA